MKNKNTSKNIFKATITLIVSCALIMPVSIAVLYVTENVADSGNSYRESGTIIYVDDDNMMGPWDGTLEHPYQYIQDGIDASNNNDTVFVFDGIYNENNIKVNKSIFLYGENRNNTIINGGSDTVVVISASMVTISRFTLIGSNTTQSSNNGINISSDYVAITDNSIMNCSNSIFFRHENSCSTFITIKDNLLTDNDIAIWDLYAGRNNITENTFNNNTYGVYLGIAGPLPWNPHLVKWHTPSYNNITGNTFIANNYSIMMVDSVPSNITDNIITDTNSYGIYINDCKEGTPDDPFYIPGDNLFISRNFISGSGRGIYLLGSSCNTITHNIVMNSSGYGILLSSKGAAFGLKPSAYNILIENTIINNTEGIYIGEICNNTVVVNNTVAFSDEKGIRLWGSGNNNVSRNTVTDGNGEGIQLRLSEYNTVAANYVAFNEGSGIKLNRLSENNRISGNIIENNNLSGVVLRESSHNNVTQNTISNNTNYGINLIVSANTNCIYHNSFSENLGGNVNIDEDCENNIWNSTYPFAGNYWDDHEQHDGYQGPNQDIPGCDGIVDLPGGGFNPYIITSEDNKDWYPLKNPFILLANAGGPYIGYLGEPHNFSGSADGLFPPFNWFWDFGDGNTSEEQNPVHIYNLTGTFTVVLNVSDSQGNYDNDATTITIEIGELIANAHGPYYGLVDDPIQFTGSAHYGVKPYSWYWEFGDGNISFEQNPIHIYTTQRLYTVTLTVTDNTGNSTNDITICDIRLLPPVHNINKDTYYWWIQEAINEASDEDEISVQNRTYYENIVINKSISMIGEDKNNTIIDGSNHDDVVKIIADNVMISRFTIQNSGSDEGFSGIIINSNNNIVVGNHLQNNSDYGILVSHTSYNYISTNTIMDSYYALYLYDDVFHTGICTENILTGNTIINNKHGIYVDFSVDNTITSNTIINNNGTGLRLLYLADYNTISDNVFSDNKNGIILTASNENIITGNIIMNNEVDGIRFPATDYNNIITYNTIENNLRYGLYIRGSPSNNIIYHNNFINNTDGNAVDECTNIWNDTYPSGGNYWSDFDESGEGAYDNDSDGIADSPYNISGGSNQDNYPLMNPFNIENKPPYQPSSPSPEDDATGISVNTYISWIGGDPDPYDTVTYDVYFGTTSPPPQVAENQSETTYDPPNDMGYGTVYYWQIVAWDEHGLDNASDEWYFTTEYDLGSAFLLGFITDFDDTEDYIKFNAKLLLYVDLEVLDINICSSGENIIISKDYAGYVGSRFTIGRFDAAVVANETISFSSIFGGKQNE